MMLGHKQSAVEDRKQQITRQLDYLRSQLVKRRPSHYANETVYRQQLKRSHELISDLEAELLILDCPGEYDELPIAVVADELGFTYEQIRSLIRLGEIAATGKTAHERICRGELERIITAGTPTLLRLAKEEPADIFEQTVPLLQSGDLEAARRAYRRLDARQSWRGPHAPAFLVGLELASGELDGALSSLKLIYEHEDQRQRLIIMTYLGRLLRGVTPEESGARELRDQFIMLAEGAATAGRRVHTQPKQPAKKRLAELQQRAIYLTTSVMNELRKRQIRGTDFIADNPPETAYGEAHRIIRDAIYTALYAEVFYEESSLSRIHVDLLRGMTPKSYAPANLLKTL